MGASNPAVSFITAVYNDENCVAETIERALT